MKQGLRSFLEFLAGSFCIQIRAARPKLYFQGRDIGVSVGMLLDSCLRSGGAEVAFEEVDVGQHLGALLLHAVGSLTLH